MRFKADIFFFGVFFIAGLCLVFSTFKQMNNPTVKQGLLESSEIMTKPMR